MKLFEKLKRFGKKDEDEMEEVRRRFDEMYPTEEVAEERKKIMQQRIRPWTQGEGRVGDMSVEDVPVAEAVKDV